MAHLNRTPARPRVVSSSPAYPARWVAGAFVAATLVAAAGCASDVAQDTRISSTDSSAAGAAGSGGAEPSVECVEGAKVVCHDPCNGDAYLGACLEGKERCDRDGRTCPAVIGTGGAGGTDPGTAGNAGTGGTGAGGDFGGAIAEPWCDAATQPTCIDPCTSQPYAATCSNEGLWQCTLGDTCNYAGGDAESFGGSAP